MERPATGGVWRTKSKLSQETQRAREFKGSRTLTRLGSAAESETSCNEPFESEPRRTSTGSRTEIRNETQNESRDEGRVISQFSFGRIAYRVETAANSSRSARSCETAPGGERQGYDWLSSDPCYENRLHSLFRSIPTETSLRGKATQVPTRTRVHLFFPLL